MSVPDLRSYRVALADSGAYAVWVTAESREAACELARSTLPSSPGPVEILDEYDDTDMA